MLVRRRLLAGVAVAGGVASGGLQAQMPFWPGGRSVTMVVGFPPGGQADVSGRPFAAALERVIGAPVPVVNRPGASGGLGNAFVARAPGDGLTVLMALSSMLTLPEADRIHGRVAQYEIDQLAPIARVTADPTVLVVPAASPWRNLGELVADAKRRPGAISYSSAGNFSALHTPMAMFTARLMLGDCRTGIVFAASAIACRSGSSRPVVATTNGTFLATHVATIPATASGSEKSITTSAGQSQADAIATSADGSPASKPASLPARG
jgi:hypothetical protein